MDQWIKESRALAAKQNDLEAVPAPRGEVVILIPGFVLYVSLFPAIRKNKNLTVVDYSNATDLSSLRELGDMPKNVIIVADEEFYHSTNSSVNQYMINTIVQTLTRVPGTQFGILWLCRDMNYQKVPQFPFWSTQRASAVLGVHLIRGLNPKEEYYYFDNKLEADVVLADLINKMK